MSGLKLRSGRVPIQGEKSTFVLIGNNFNSRLSPVILRQRETFECSNMRRIIPSVSAVLRRHLHTFGILIGVAVIIMLFAPRGQRFQYEFSKGKPWQYDLLTAPYDFPIYKAEAELRLQEDSIRAAMLPVYTYDSEVMAINLNKLQDDYNKSYARQVSPHYLTYLQEQLRKLYTDGLVSVSDKERLRAQNKLEVQVIDGDNVLSKVPLGRFYTLREAYEQIYDGLPNGLDRSVLSIIQINNYLQENILYDEGLDQQLQGEELSKLSRSTGMVQQGERIIDRGEIISPHIHDILRSLRIEQEQRLGQVSHSRVVNLGVFFSVLIVMSLLASYLALFSVHFIIQLKNVLFLACAMLLFVVLTELNASYDWFNGHIIPYVMLPIMVRIFFDSHTALITYVSCILCSALFVPEPLYFIIIQLCAGLASVISLQTLTKRGDIIRAVFVVYATYSISSMALALFRDGTIDQSYWIIQLYYAINLIFLTFTYILVAVVERAFGYVSNVSLVELSDMDAPLLRELSEVAPGTFQHSLQVSILCTEAAAKVGADVQLIRTGALYHDIGKMKNPAYFTENQGVFNPHQALRCEESAHIIIRHVTDGIALAQKHNLPPQIIEFIRTHHGAGTTKYFYNTYCNEHPEEEVDPTPFTYPGPNPYTKETGILMLADAVEASSRSLKEHTEEGISQLINRIVDSIVADGLLNDTPLTFRDIKVIKEVFYTKIRTMYHSRISYPDKQAPTQATQ